MVCQPVLPMITTIPTQGRGDTPALPLLPLRRPRTSMGPIVAGAVLAVAGLLFGLPGVLLLAISVVLATAGVALLIARPHEQPDATIASERRARAR